MSSSSSESARSAPIDPTWRWRRTPACSAASANSAAAPRSTVSLRVLPAARSGAGREDRDIRTGQYAGDRRDVGLLQIAVRRPARRPRRDRPRDRGCAPARRPRGRHRPAASSAAARSVRVHPQSRLAYPEPNPRENQADCTRAARNDRRRNPDRLSGSRRGQPLVLLAGQSNNHHWWDPVRADFEATYRTITLDWRGTGDSDKPDEVYSTPGFADDVVAVLDELGLAKAHVYGTSMGGRVAQWIAINHPGRVDALVLGCTSPGAAHGYERSQEIRRALADPERTDRAPRPDVHAGVAGREPRPVPGPR